MTDIRSYFRRETRAQTISPAKKEEVSKNEITGKKRKRALDDDSTTVGTESDEKTSPSSRARKKQKTSSSSDVTSFKESETVPSSEKKKETVQTQETASVKKPEKRAYQRVKKEMFEKSEQTEAVSDTTKTSLTKQHTTQTPKKKEKSSQSKTKDLNNKRNKKKKQKTEKQKEKENEKKKTSEKETRVAGEEKEVKHETRQQSEVQSNRLKFEVLNNEKKEREKETLPHVNVPTEQKEENKKYKAMSEEKEKKHSDSTKRMILSESEVSKVLEKEEEEEEEEMIEDSSSPPQRERTKHSIHPTSSTTSSSLSPSAHSPPSCAPKKSWSYSWRQYLNRPAPPHKGTKTLPTGQPNCLHGKVFVITGVLDSLEREEAVDLILKYGGEVTKSVAKKTTHALVGLEPGPGKMTQIKARGLPIIDEDGLFEMIRTLPAQVVTQSPSKKKPKSSAKLTNISTTSSFMLSTATSATTTTSLPGERSTSTSSQLWTEKYRPASVKEIIGNPGAIKELITWLKNFQQESAEENSAEMKKKKEKTGSEPVAALISGPPGIGKTTAAILVCESLGFTPILSNASDERNKSNIQDHLQGSLQNRSLYEFWTNTPRKSVLIMDEIDGMSSGDRGGIAELIREMRYTKRPIICICNDRYSPKVRSLVSHCKDIRFRRPTVQQILPRVRAILEAENIKLGEETLRRIIESANGDIRQILNLLQLWAVQWQNLNDKNVTPRLQMTTKNVDLGPWDVVPKLFGSVFEQPLSNRLDYYFVDTNLVPLMVQEAYLKIPNSTPLQKVAHAADIISVADTVERLVYRDQKWELQPLHGFLSSVFPGIIMQTSLTARLEFPVWFGKNSTQTKYQRLLQDLTLHMYPTTWSDKHVVRLDYLPVLRLCLTEPLLRDGVNGIDRVIDIMDAYSLTREQREILIELDELSDSTEGSELRSIQKLIPTQVKTALTRRYNQKKHTTTPLSTTTLKKKSRRRSDVVTQAISNEDEVAALMDEEEEKDQDQDQEEKEGEEERESAQQQNEQNAAKSALALDALVTVGRSETKTKTQIKTTSDRSKKTKHN